MTIRLGVKPIGWSNDELQDIGDIPLIGIGSGVYAVPGDGVIDYAATFRELTGASGWVIVEAEQDPGKAPRLPYARKGVAHCARRRVRAGSAETRKARS
jgi:sugar phosphate isomerase/epimerase